MPAVEQRFQLSASFADRAEPGLIRELDGTVWLINPDGTREQVGGGGGLPSWWAVDSTPGSESVEFGGAVAIRPATAKDGLVIDLPAGTTGFPLSATVDFNGDGFGFYVTPRGEAQVYASGLGIRAALEVSQEGTETDLVRLGNPSAREVIVGPTGAVTITPSDLAGGDHALTATGPVTIIGDDAVGANALYIQGNDLNHVFELWNKGGNDRLFDVTETGAVKISPSGDGDGHPFLDVEGVDAQTALLGIFATWDGQSVSIDAEAKLEVNDGLLGGDTGNVFSADPINNKLGFFKSTAVTKPTGVAATGPGVHAALVTLGLIAA